MLGAVFAVQVLPRPLISQMNSLLVSQIYDESSTSSAAQSFNQGGFSLGCLCLTVLSATMPTALDVFPVTGILALVTGSFFYLLPPLPIQQGVEACSKCHRDSSILTGHMGYMGVMGILAVGIEAACGTWLITTLCQMGVDMAWAKFANAEFWILFAAGRLIIAPAICSLCDLRAHTCIVGGAAFSILSALGSLVFPTNFIAICIAVGGIAVGIGPAFAMVISMAKDISPLTLKDSAVFAAAGIVGTAGVPSLVGGVLAMLGPSAVILCLVLMCLILLIMASYAQQQPWLLAAGTNSSAQSLLDA